MKKTKNVVAITLLFSGYAFASDGEPVERLEVVASASGDGNGQSTSDQVPAARGDQDNFQDASKEQPPVTAEDGAQAAQPDAGVDGVPAVRGLGEIVRLAAKARAQKVPTDELSSAIIHELTGGKKPNVGSFAGEGRAVDFAAEIRARHGMLNQTGLLRK